MYASVCMVNFSYRPVLIQSNNAIIVCVVHVEQDYKNTQSKNGFIRFSSSHRISQRKLRKKQLDVCLRRYWNNSTMTIYCSPITNLLVTAINYSLLITRHFDYFADLRFNVALSPFYKCITVTVGRLC